jgi:protein AATF/BFR2
MMGKHVFLTELRTDGKSLCNASILFIHSGLWDTLLESRIKIQKALVQVNKLPQHTTWKTFTQRGGQEFKQAASQSQTALKTLLDQLVNLQTALLLQNPETQHMVEGHGKPKKV